MAPIVKGEFIDNGYILLKGFFARDESESIRQEAKAIFFEQMKCHHIVTATPSDEAAFLHPIQRGVGRTNHQATMKIGQPWTGGHQKVVADRGRND